MEKKKERCGHEDCLSNVKLVDAKFWWLKRETSNENRLPSMKKELSVLIYGFNPTERGQFIPKIAKTFSPLEIAG